MSFQTTKSDKVLEKFKYYGDYVTILDAARYFDICRNRLRDDLESDGVFVSALGGRGYRVRVSDLAAWADRNNIRTASELQPAGVQGSLFQ